MSGENWRCRCICGCEMCRSSYPNWYTRPVLTTWPHVACCSRTTLVASPVEDRVKLCLLVHKIQLGRSLRYLSDLLTLAADVPGRPSVQSLSRSDHCATYKLQVRGQSFLCCCSPSLETDYQWNWDTYVPHHCSSADWKHFYLLLSSRSEL